MTTSEKDPTRNMSKQDRPRRCTCGSTEAHRIVEFKVVFPAPSFEPVESDRSTIRCIACGAEWHTIKDVSTIRFYDFQAQQ